MRDSHILAGLSQVEYKAGHDVRVLAEQVRLIRFRQEAVEEVLFGSRIRSIAVALLLVCRPAAILKMIDRCMNDNNAEYEKEYERRMQANLGVLK